MELQAVSRTPLAMGRAAEEHRLRFIDEVSWESRMRPVVDAATV